MQKQHVFAALTAIVCVVVSLPNPPAAQQRMVVRWSDVKKSIDKHPALRVAGERVSLAEAEVKVARQYPNPTVELEAGQARSLDGSDTAPLLGVALTFPLQSPGIYTNEAAGRRAEAEAAGYEAADARLEAVRQLRALFLGIAADQALAGMLAESRTQLKKLVEVAEARVHAGEARPMDLARLEIELDRLDIRMEGTVEEASARRRILSTWLGEAYPENFEVDMDIFALPSLEAMDDLWDRAQKSHPEILAAALRTRASALSIKAEKHKGAPEMSLGGFYDRELDSQNFGGKLGITLPVWNRNSGGVARARAAQKLAERTEALARVELKTALLEAFASVKSSRARALGYKERILPKVRKTADDLTQMYRLGEVGVMDILDARRSLADAQTELLEALREAQLAHLELHILIGGDGHEQD